MNHVIFIIRSAWFIGEFFYAEKANPRWDVWLGRNGFKKQYIYIVLNTNYVLHAAVYFYYKLLKRKHWSVIVSPDSS